MPFQDIDDDGTLEVPEPPSTIERWARQVFVEDLGLKLIALGITLVIWFAVTSENTPVTISTAVQLNFISPESLEVSNDPPRTINVLLNGTKLKLNTINSVDLVATIDLSDFRSGERVIRLSQERVSIPLPEGVTIQSFQPGTVTVRLEPRIERQLPVEVRIEGKPAEGSEVYGTHSTPNYVRVQGPTSHVAELQKAPTESVSVDGRKESFSVQQVLIDIRSQKVELLDLAVDLYVEIGEKRLERRFDNVQVRARNDVPILPTVASVVLSGPVSIIERLRPEEIVIIVDKPGSGESNPQLQLPSGLQQQVKLVSIKPAIFQ